MVKALKEKTGKGYDGVISEGFREWVAFEPNQIKLAVGNTGAFSPDSDDIRFAKREKKTPLQQAIDKPLGTDRMNPVTSIYRRQADIERLQKEKNRLIATMRLMRNNGAIDALAEANDAIQNFDQYVSSLKKSYQLSQMKVTTEQVKAQLIDNIRRQISAYARLVGYQGRIPEYIAGVKSLRGLEKSLERINQAVQDRLHSDTYKRVESLIDKRRKQIARWRKKNVKVPISAEYIRAAEAYMDRVTGKVQALDLDDIAMRIAQKKRGKRLR